jgi:hypothetical protein
MHLGASLNWKRAPMTKRNSDMAETSRQRRPTPPGMPSGTEIDEMLATKVPFSSRITLAAQRELATMGREKRLSTVQLLARALNLLFEKEGRKPVA